MKYNGIIFDFNGTLLFDTDLHVKAWDTIAKKLHKGPITYETIVRNYWGLANEELLRKLTDNIYSDQEYQQLSQEKEALYRQYVCENKQYQLVDGVMDFFNYLKNNNIPFTIASASIKENIDFYVTHFKLKKWIDPAMIVYDNGQYKNKEEMYAQAIKILNLKKPYLIFEDSINGIKSALKTGADVIGIDTPTLRSLKPNGIKTYIKDYKNILNLIK